MRIGLALPAMLDGLDRRLLLSWARRIEADGYSTVGFGERISYRNLEVFTVLAAAAAVTERVDIAASVVVLPMHSEVVGGEADGDARRDLGWAGRAGRRRGRAPRGLPGPRRGPSSRRWDRLDAQVARIRSVWAGAAPGAGLDPVGPPPVHRIPIISAGVGRRSLARSAVWADGINGFELDPLGPGLADGRHAHPRGVGRQRTAGGAGGDDVVVVRARARPDAPAPRLRPPLPRRVRRRTWRRRSPRRAPPPAPSGAGRGRWPPPPPATTRSSSSPPSPTWPSSTSSPSSCSDLL